MEAMTPGYGDDSVDPGADTGEFVALQDIKTGETEEYQGPPPVAILVDPETGKLPAGWRFDD